MPIDREKNKQLKVTIPNDLHRKLKIISERIGIPNLMTSTGSSRSYPRE
jgi:hypothetical protein